MQSLSRHEVDALADEIALASAHIDAATHALLSSIRRFDDHKGWAHQGAKSCAHWLSWRVGLGLNAAREQVRVARALADLPQIDAALGRGELSFAKVRAMTRVATPANEQRLLDMARGSTGAQLERVCRGYRQVQALAEGSHLDDERWLRQRRSPGGRVRIEAQLLPDEAELVMHALQAVRDALREERKASPDVTAVTSEAALADALVLIAKSSSVANLDRASRSPRRDLIVHLRDEHLASSAWKADLADGTSLSGAALRRLACDAGLVVAKTDRHGTPLDIGRKRRTVPPSLARALRLRDGGCRFPGCTHRAFVDAHHLEHWADGGATTLANLILLCHHHHVAVHEGGFRVTRAADGTIQVYAPDGRPLDPAPSPPALPADAGLASLTQANTATGTTIDRTTSLPRWHGQPLDLHAAVSALLARTNQGISAGMQE